MRPDERQLLVTSSYLLPHPCSPVPPSPASYRQPDRHVLPRPLPFPLTAPPGGNNRDREIQNGSRPLLSGPSPPGGPNRISAQPILMHVFRNKLASLLKSLLWPMNIWCGQGCGVKGYNDRVLSYLARQRRSVPGPTQNTPLLSWDLEEPNPGEGDTMKTFFSSICPHLWSVKSPALEMAPITAVGWKPNWEQNAFFFFLPPTHPCLWLTFGGIRQWAFNTFNGPKSDITHPGIFTGLTK